MGIFDALFNRGRKKAKEIEKALRDPIADGMAAIEDSEKKLKEFQDKIAQLMSRNKQIEREFEGVVAEITKYTRIAKSALVSGNDADAREAAEIVNTKTSLKNTLEGELKQNGALVTNLRTQLERGRAKVQGAKTDKVRLEAKLEGAKVREGLAKASSEFAGDDNPLSALDDLKKTVEEAECKAEAFEELVGMEPGNVAADLESKYGSQAGSGVDDLLSQLKAEVDDEKSGTK